MNEIGIAKLAAEPVVTTTDQVYAALYKAVIEVQLPPGSKLSEAEIAKQLDVSRQPVRDAFFRLSKQGFLLVRPQRATLVTQISARAVLDAVFVRTALEVACMRNVCARATPDDIAALRANMAAQENALHGENRAHFHELDEEFHGLLCRIAGHAHIWDLIREQKAHMDRVRFLTLSEERRKQVHAEHDRIVAAIEAGDADAADALLRAHMDNIHSALETARADHPDYFADE